MMLPRPAGARIAVTALALAAATGAIRADTQLPGLLQGPETERVQIQTAGGTVEGTRVSAPHATLLTYARPAASPGSAVSLVVEITPEPDTHVYAKGATGYQPVTVTVKAAGGVRLKGTAVYPPSVLHRFEALNEIVPVYEQAFRVSQDVLVPATPPAGGRPLVVEGALVYQACTDAICYETETVQLKWSLTTPQATGKARKN